MAGYVGAALIGATFMYVLTGSSGGGSSGDGSGGAEQPVTPTPKRPRTKASMATAEVQSQGELSRQISASSQEALGKLSKLEDKYDSLDARLSDLSFSEANTVALPERSKLVKKVQQLSSDVEKFLNTEVDAVITYGLVSGKDEGRRRRKALVSRIETLQMRADGVIKKLSSSGKGASSGSTPSSTKKRRDTSPKASDSPRTGTRVSGSSPPEKRRQSTRSHSSKAAAESRRLNPPIGESY